jgi:uncharacterized membrane protein YhaH (DUF805 family)
MIKDLQKKKNNLYNDFVENYFLTFYCMADSIKFWTRDRYFSDKNEKRIGRMGFFLRMLSIFIMVALLGMAINMTLMNLIGLNAIFAWQIVMIWLSVILLFSVPVLVKKRSHDFDNNGKITSYIALGCLGFNLIMNITTLYAVYMSDFSLLMWQGMLMQILSYISKWCGIAFLIVFLILLFRPSTVGANNYWEVLK